MTEDEIIASLRARLDTPGALMAPRMYLLGQHESDLVIITKSGTIHEIEVKTTIADLRADTNPNTGSPKYRRLEALKHAASTGRLLAGWRHGASRLERVELDAWPPPTRALASPAPITPHRFTFAVPRGIADQAREEIPEWAGLITIDQHPQGYSYPLVCDRPAARLHEHTDRPPAALLERELLKRIYHRYWHARAEDEAAKRRAAADAYHQARRNGNPLS